MLKKWQQNTYVKSISVLVGGTAFAQIISFLALPIVTRLYSPSDFSVFAAYVALVQITAVGACLRYDVAIPLPDKDRDSANLLALALSAAIIASATIGISIFLFRDVVIDFIKQPALTPYLYLVPIGTLLVSLFSALQFWSIRKKRFNLIAKTRIVQSSGAATAQLSFGAARMVPLGLLFGFLAQNSIGLASFLIRIGKNDRQLLKGINISNMRKMAKEYIKFPKFSVGEVVAQTAGLQVPILIIASIPLGIEAGFLMLANRVLQAPLSLIGSAVAQVFAAEAPLSHRQKSMDVLVAKTLGGFEKIAVGPMIFIGLIAPFLFTFVFGEEWRRSGEIVSWMVIPLTVQMMASSLGTTLYVTQSQGTAFALQFGGFLIRVIAVLIAITFAPHLVVETYAISGLVFYFIYLMTVIKHAKVTIGMLRVEFVNSLPFLLSWICIGVLIQVGITSLQL